MEVICIMVQSYRTMKIINYLRKAISYENPIRVLWHRIKGVTAAVLYSFPAKKMVMIGVTGTNGKTTTTHMIEHILRSAGKRVAMMSTVEFRINGQVFPNESKKTTLSPFATQKFLKKCAQEKVNYVVLESSSHALHQSRLWGIPFAISAITNITHEHLDYHGTMKKYAEAKKILFKTVEKSCKRKEDPEVVHIPHQHAAILNKADQFFEDFYAVHCPTKIVYGVNQGDLTASKIEFSKHGSRFHLSYDGDEIEMELKVAGEFNVENALAATGVGMACKLTLSEVKTALKTFKGVPGRLEKISSPKGFDVIVDFALTPDALERLYKEIKKMAKGRIIGIIGSCGDRDKEKRPDLGRIVAENTDITIVTDEEPYSENPKLIMEAVLEGAKQVKKIRKSLRLIEDRYEAIETAVNEAKKDDVIVVTGMGNFTTRTMNDGPIEWDERKVVKEIIEKNS